MGKLLPCIFNQKSEGCCNALTDMFGPDVDEEADLEYCKFAVLASVDFTPACDPISHPWTSGPAGGGGGGGGGLITRNFALVHQDELSIHVPVLGRSLQ